MNKLLICITLFTIPLSANVISYNPQTGVYVIDQYGGMDIRPKEHVKFTKESKLTLPKKLMK